MAHRFFISETEWKVSKSVLDAAKYEFEEARETNRGLAHAKAPSKFVLTHTMAPVQPTNRKHVATI